MLRYSFVASLAVGLLTAKGFACQEQITASAEVTKPAETTVASTTSPDKTKVAVKGTTAARPKIQMAILLDTSGSMSGLIDQARTQLWNIVNEFATTTQDGQRPEFQLALYEYGKSSLLAEDGYMRQILPFSDNLDRVSEELFKLTTNGGSEHCGQVIDKAVRELTWSASPDDLKCIFIAGNEPFTQGPVDYRKACKAAIEKGVVVNTIHCGDRMAGINGKWGDGALLSDGSFSSIDHNQKVAIEAPQDKELIRLSAEVNKTYIAFGTKDWQMSNVARQVAQDSNAVKSNQAAAASRALAKCTTAYCNSGWDLVDALKDGKKKLVDIKKEDLPENMQKMTVKEREAYVADMSKKRAALQAKVKKLGTERAKYVAAELKKLEAKGKKVLDAAIIEAARSQAKKKGFKKQADEVASSK